LLKAVILNLKKSWQEKEGQEKKPPRPRSRHGGSHHKKNRSALQRRSFPALFFLPASCFDPD
jgi:hypothetical protein